MTQRINNAWFTGLSDQEKKNVEQIVLQDTILLDRLKKILYNMQEGKETTVLSDYNTPAWSHKQAHLNGQLDIIRKLVEILTVKERGDHPTI